MILRSISAFVVVATCSLSALAGPYAGISGVTPGAPDNPIPRSSFTTFETSVVNYSPAPGVGASFQNLQNGVASLGDLFSPVPSPTGSNTPVQQDLRAANRNHAERGAVGPVRRKRERSERQLRLHRHRPARARSRWASVRTKS